jgi:hypothetical protein
MMPKTQHLHNGSTDCVGRWNVGCFGSRRPCKTLCIPVAFATSLRPSVTVVALGRMLAGNPHRGRAAVGSPETRCRAVERAAVWWS